MRYHSPFPEFKISCKNVPYNSEMMSKEREIKLQNDMFPFTESQIILIN